MKNSYIITVGLFAAVVAATYHDSANNLNGGINGRIINGIEAVPKQFPYQIGLKISKPNLTAWCGGSLISKIFLITAAHCAINATGAIVYLGATNIDDANEVGQQRIYVNGSCFLVHKDYNEDTLVNDIALIRLPDEVIPNDYINFIKLPNIDGLYETYGGEECTLSGWGKTHSIDTNITNKLHYGNVKILPNLLCKIPYLGTVKDSMICSYGIQSACQGDSGGPLVYKDKLIGITSYGLALLCDGTSVYTRVTSFVDWIYETMNKYNNSCAGL